jgi:hypothetical protein
MVSRALGRIKLDEPALQKDLATIADSPRIAEEYDEFSSGFWKNCSLWNDTGDSLDTQYKAYEGPPRRTPLGAQLPYIDDVLSRYFDFRNLKMVRVRNLVDAIIIPHRDFVELEGESSRFFRVFLALEHNADSFHSDEANVFQMQPGEIWWLDAATVHAAANFSRRSRAHLCLDFQFRDGGFCSSDIFKDPAKIELNVTPTLKPRSPFDTEENTLLALSSLLAPHTFKDITFLLSKVHFEKAVPISACFDWLTAMADHQGNRALAAKARNLRSYMIERRELGERFSYAE